MSSHILILTNLVYIEAVLITIVLTMLTKTQGSMQSTSVLNQLELFREITGGPVGVMTTSAGAPISVIEATNTLNTPLILNEYFMDSVTHLARERIPERVVHAKGAGGFGYFIVTHNITSICKAKLFSRDGKKTPIAIRFSIISVERGSSDVYRDGRGFSVKFYTEDGNLDIVGLSTPAFVFNEPLLFPTFAHSSKRNPATNLRDPNMLWDFLTLHPETFNMFFRIFGDSGIFNGYRHMPGYSIHTYQVENERGDINFIRFHFIPESGTKSLTSEQATTIQRTDFDYNIRDLYQAIGNGNFPVWIVYIQIVSLVEAKREGSIIFDITRILSEDKYPLRPIGKLVLTRNPVNYFAEIEQLAFTPANLVDGVLGAPDIVFQSRRLSYRDSQHYRLGANHNKIHVNCPLNKVLAYNRDGVPPVRDNEGDMPNYFPNSFNGPVPYVDKNRSRLVKIIEREPNNFDQTRELYANGMTDDQRSRMIENIVDSLGTVTGFLQQRAVNIFKIIHPDLSSRIEQGLLLNKLRQRQNNTRIPFKNRIYHN